MHFGILRNKEISVFWELVFGFNILQSLMSMRKIKFYVENVPDSSQFYKAGFSTVNRTLLIAILVLSSYIEEELL